MTTDCIAITLKSNFEREVPFRDAFRTAHGSMAHLWHLRLRCRAANKSRVEPFQRQINHPQDVIVRANERVIVWCPFGVFAFEIVQESTSSVVERLLFAVAEACDRSDGSP